MGGPGILAVASSITRPEKLTEERWNEWYENVHSDEVCALSGVHSASRYEAIPLSMIAGPQTPESIEAEKNKPSYLIPHKWFQIYEFNDINFKDSAEFKGLDGQTNPKGDLLEVIFKNAQMDCRFGELISKDEKPGALKIPAPLIIVAAMTPGSKENKIDIENFYEQEHVKEISKVPGYVRTRRFKYIHTSLLYEFERKPLPVAKADWSTVAIHEFDGAYLPMADLMKCDETPWTARVIEGLAKDGMEAGFFRLKRIYGDFLKEHAKL